MRKIKAAVVGLGGNGMGAVDAAKSSEHVSEVIAVDLNEKRCQRAEKNFGVKSTQDFGEILANDDVELVYISTDNATHYPIGKASLEADKKVCMEKPMGISLEETEELLEITQKRGGFLQVGFELRHYSKLYARVKEILESGEIGTLRHINFQYVLSPWGNETPAQQWKHSIKGSGGIFQEKLCHYVDLPRWWDGSRVTQYFITKAENVIPYYEVPDNVELTYKFDSGVVSHMSFIFGAAGAGKNDLIDTSDLDAQKNQGYRLYYQLIGSEGALEANVFHRELRVFHHPGKDGLGDKSRMDRVEAWEQPDDHLYFHNTKDEKIDVARRVACGLEPAIDPADAAETMRLCYEFEKAITEPWRVIER